MSVTCQAEKALCPAPTRLLSKTKKEIIVVVCSVAIRACWGHFWPHTTLGYGASKTSPVPDFFISLGRSRVWGSMQAEERYFPKYASEIGTGMILLKAKVCITLTIHGLLQVPHQCRKNWHFHQEGRTPPGRREQKQGTKPSASTFQPSATFI